MKLSDFEEGSPEREILIACMKVRLAMGQCLQCTKMAEEHSVFCREHETNGPPAGSNSTEEQKW